LRGTFVALNDDTVVDPIANHSIRDPGPASLAAKPHCVSALGADLILVRCRDLLSALQTRPQNLTLRSLAIWLGYIADTSGRLLVYEPLLRMYVDTASALIQDDAVGLSHARKYVFEHLGRPAPHIRRGLSGFVTGSYLHS